MFFFFKLGGSSQSESCGLSLSQGTDIQQMDEYNGILPEFIIPAARGFAIKDVAEAQRAFRDLVSQCL